MIPEMLTVNGVSYSVVRLLGHGKGGYSYLAEGDRGPVVVKQIHHEPCDYYQFGDKIAAECRDYERLQAAGIPMPRMIDVDMGAERIVKEFIDGPTVAELVRQDRMTEAIFAQGQHIANLARAAGLNIDYYPTNFVLQNGALFYVDYECNPFMEAWSFEGWGAQYWSKTEAFMEKLGTPGK